MRVKIGTVYLAGGDGATEADEFGVDSPVLLATVHAFRAAFGKHRERGNITHTVRFNSKRLHSTVADAERFVLYHGQEIPRSGIVEWILTDESETSYTDASVIQVSGNRNIGLTTVTQYTVFCGEFLDENPETA